MYYGRHIPGHLRLTQPGDGTRELTQIDRFVLKNFREKHGIKESNCGTDTRDGKR